MTPLAKHEILPTAFLTGFFEKFAKIPDELLQYEPRVIVKSEESMDSSIQRVGVTMNNCDKYEIDASMYQAIHDALL